MFSATTGPSTEKILNRRPYLQQCQRSLHLLCGITTWLLIQKWLLPLQAITSLVTWEETNREKKQWPVEYFSKLFSSCDIVGNRIWKNCLFREIYFVMFVIRNTIFEISFWAIPSHLLLLFELHERLVQQISSHKTNLPKCISMTIEIAYWSFWRHGRFTIPWESFCTIMHDGVAVIRNTMVLTLITDLEKRGSENYQKTIQNIPDIQIGNMGWCSSCELLWIYPYPSSFGYATLQRGERAHGEVLLLSKRESKSWIPSFLVNAMWQPQLCTLHDLQVCICFQE